MSKKLLNEGTVRRFMKLANIGALSGGFVNEMDYTRDDEVYEEEEELAVVDADPEGAAEPELDMEPGLEPEPEGGAENEDLLKRVVQAVATELDVEVEIEGEEAAEEEFPPEEELADEEALDAEVPEEEPDILETVEAMLAEAGVEVVDDEAVTEGLIKRVSARVAKRLLKEFS